MKKKFVLSAVLCALMASAFTANVIAAESNLKAEAVKGTPVVDGVVDDIWSTAVSRTADALKDGTDEGITTQWKVMWDDEQLYFLIAVVNDTNHFFNGAQAWGDGCELYFDALNNDPTDYTSDDGVVQIGWDAETPDDTVYKGTDTAQANIEGQYKIVAVENENGYLYEVSVDLDAFCKDVVMAEGTVIGFDLQVNSKSDDSESRTSAYGWADAMNVGWQDPSVFGDIVLVAAPEAPAEDVPAEDGTVDAGTTAPVTADAGIVAAAAVMAAAAGVVLSKKH